MNRAKIIIIIILITGMAAPAYSSRRLSSGRYSRYHQNKHFRIAPPKIFDKIRPTKHGVRLFNATDKVTVTIDALEIDNPKLLSDRNLLMRFQKSDFRAEFFGELEGLTSRIVKDNQFRKINNKKVFEFTMVDPKSNSFPLRSIIFYVYGKEFRINLEVENVAALAKHDHFIIDIFGHLGIIE